MKFAAFAVIFTLLVVSTLARRRNKRCSSNEDCEENECCLSRTILGFRKGDCRPLAKAGDKCSSDEDELFGGRYVIHCPCEQGLSCEPTKEKDLGVFGKLKINERCVSEPSTRQPDTEAPTVETEQPVSETEEPIPETEEPVSETEAPVEE